MDPDRRMTPIRTTLHHKIIPPRKQFGGNSPAVILLHGRGANEDDLLGLADRLDERVFFVAVRAPFPFQSGGFTWFDIVNAGIPEPGMFAESYQRLSQFCDDVKNGYPIDPSRIFFLGFSMGTMMSYSIALTKPQTVAGVAANSGYIPENADLKFQWDQVAGIPFFVAHGTLDPVIPVKLGRRARALLEDAKADLVYREYPMGHEISQENLYDMTTWLTEKLGGQ